jgi:4,5-DOPA dioxygenase extradiol
VQQRLSTDAGAKEVVMSSTNSLVTSSVAAPSARMPALFLGHGSPMNAIQTNSFTDTLARLGTTLPRPRAVLVVSAHWRSRGTRVVGVERPATIHDFSGFPKELYDMIYAAPGSPATAARVTELLARHEAQEDSEWGLDHGTWSVLRHMYPHADVPVLQLSLDRSLDLRGHFDLARDLAALRDEGILIVGSGNITHNLGALAFDPNEPDLPWAVEFDQLVKTALEQRDIARLTTVPPSMSALWRQAHPTLEHYLPLLYVLAVSTENEAPTFPYEGMQLGSLSMRAVAYGT